MSQFVEDCRREWKRLRVPDPVANEMAADLAADLTEAEAEGVSAEEVLGSGVFDPPSFAASWASERGLIPPPPVRTGAPAVTRKWLPGRSHPLAALAASGFIAIIGVVLATARSGSEQALASPFIRRITLPPPPPYPRAVAVHMSFPGTHLQTFGLILLLIGTLGLILSMLSWAPWANHNRSPRRSGNI